MIKSTRQNTAVVIMAIVFAFTVCMAATTVWTTSFTAAMEPFYEEPTSGSCGNNLEWELYDDVLIISGDGDMFNYEEGQTPWSGYGNEITRVILRGAITCIGSFAFSGMQMLENFTIPDTVRHIGDFAFSGCTDLISFFIPAGTEVIGSGILSGCTRLQQIDIDKDSPYFHTVDGVLFNADYTELIMYPAGRDGYYTMPDTTGTVKSHAFNGAIRLKLVIFDGSVQNWDNVLIEEGNEILTNAEIIFLKNEESTQAEIQEEAQDSSLPDTAENNAVVDSWIQSPLDARNGVVRILNTDNLDDPHFYSTGSGFGIGIAGEATDLFVTNRHVVFNDYTEKISDHVYIMLDDDAVTETYTFFGDFYDDDHGYFKVTFNQNSLVECEVLYPSDSDPEYPDLAIIHAERIVDGRVALSLLSADEVPDSTQVWTIGYPGSADKLYNNDTMRDEVKLEADVDGAQLFTGTISRRGNMKNTGGTTALTHSAQIDHGNSGGPLVTANGQVIGINTYGYESAETASVGYYMSIVIDYAMDRLEKLGLSYNMTPEEFQLMHDHLVEESTVPKVDTDTTQAVTLDTSSLETQNVSLVETSISYATGTEEMESWSEYKYNEFGDKTVWYLYNSDGTLKYYHEYTYDEYGNELSDCKYNPKGRILEREEYTYDADGNQMTYRMYDEDGELSAWADVVCDDNGNRLQRVYHSTYGTYTYYYNEDGTTRKEVSVDSDGTFRSQEEYDYDESGNLIAEIEFDKNGYLEEYNQYEYDENGNRINKIWYDENQQVKFIYFYEYDEYGNKISETTFDSRQELFDYEEFYYDDDGEYIGSITYDSDGEVKSLYYSVDETDEDGNKIYSASFYNDSLRTEYYYTVTEILVRP